MENGSRALIIAATVLLGVFLLTMMFYMFRAGGKVSKAHDDKQITLQLENYNSQFELYARPNNTITDVVSLANLVYSTNEECEFSKGHTVKLEVDIGGVIYSIPDEYKDQTKIKPEEKKYLTKRNTIALGDEKKEVSIYDMLNCPVNRLKTLEDTASQQITLDVYRREEYKSLYSPQPAIPASQTIDTENETLAQSGLISNNRRIYKYIFVCEDDGDFKYHDSTGKVQYIKLKLYINPEYIHKLEN